MKQLMAVTLAILGVGASSALAQAPQRGGGGGAGMMTGMMLLNQKSVQHELKITDEQSQKIQEAQAKMMESFAGLADLDQNERRQKMQELAHEGERTAVKILKREQMKRFKEISLQVQGMRAFSDPETAKTLDLTDEQKDKIKGIEEEARKRMAELRQGGGAGGDPQAMRKKMQEFSKNNAEKVVSMLTADQKAKWKEMTGEPFKGEIQMGFPGGGRGQRN